jgi:predicted ATP-dependent protease
MKMTRAASKKIMVFYIRKRIDSSSVSLRDYEFLLRQVENYAKKKGKNKITARDVSLKDLENIFESCSSNNLS